MADPAELRVRVEAKLREGLAASHVEIEDESHRHAGHPGARGGGRHLRATIVSERFAGLSRVQAQRLVYEVLAEELRGEVHALAMRTLTPEQFRAAAGDPGGPADPG